MRSTTRGAVLISVLLAMLTGCAECAMAQSPLPTTTVQDTVYSASGAPASGTVLVSWAAFTTATGAAVPAGSTSATIGSNGVLSISLAPNAGATPIGSYYTATYHLIDGTTSRQFWIVPTTVPGGGPAKLAAIQNQVLPTSVAMQTVSKAYVDGAIAAATTGHPADTTSIYVLKTGDTMTGPLVLPADPVSPNQAADKNYVDENVTAIASGVGQKVSLLPSGTQVVAQPSGSQLEVNLLNGELYATQYLSGNGNNGIANALASPDCANGCQVDVEPTYPGNDAANVANMPNTSAVVDRRGGAETRTGYNPLGRNTDTNVSETIQQTATLSAPQLQTLRPGALGVGATALGLSMQALTGGSNLFPQDIETPPYFKSTYGALQLTGTYNTQGQHVQFGNVVNCYGVGDCLAGGQFITSSGGYRDNADEGAHPFDLQIAEDYRVFEGTCSTGCSTGATSLNVTASAYAGTQGDGRFLIDTNPAKTISTGQITGGQFAVTGGYLPFGQASFSGTSFPVSVLLQTTVAATSQPANMAPGTVTLPIDTNETYPGYSASTAALPSSTGVACVANGGGGSSDTPNFEMANYTVVDAGHITLTLNKPHIAGATIAVGGLCGYGIEQTADTKYGIRQLYPVVGSTSASALYYAESGMPLLGNHSAGSTSAYLNQSFAIASIARSANVVTVTVAGSPLYDLNALTLTVAGVSDSSYNGSFQVATTGATTFTYASTGPDSTSSGGTLSYLTGGYVLYPMAEVLSVYDPANKQVDGTFTLAPNTAAWAAGDAVEQPHYYKQLTYADSELVTQYVPRPEQHVSAGKIYKGLIGVGARGWEIANDTPVNSYFGAGGSYNVPDDAYSVTGPWLNDFEVDAGVNAVTRVHCNLYTCNRWDSTYKLFDLDAVVGEDYLFYSPQARTAAWQLGGSSYSFSPQAFTAGTINVGTLNATTISGGVAAGAITSGTINPARLPVFGPSGATHAVGAVPDPGPVAGSSRYLREDGIWISPASGGAAGAVLLAPGGAQTISQPAGSSLVVAGAGSFSPHTISPDGTNPILWKDAAGNITKIELFANSAITDFCNASTTGSIAWAINQLGTRGGNLTLHDGYYNYGQTCLVDWDWITIEGISSPYWGGATAAAPQFVTAGQPGGAQMVPTASGLTTFTIGNTVANMHGDTRHKGLTFRRINFNGAGVATNGIADLTASQIDDDITVEDNNVQGYTNCGVVDAWDYHVIRRNSFQANTGNAICEIGGYAGQIVDNIMFDNVGPYSTCVYATGGYHTIIAHNTCGDSKYSFSIAGGQGQVTDNTIYANPGATVPQPVTVTGGSWMVAGNESSTSASSSNPFTIGSAGQFQVDTSGNATAPTYSGPAVAPSGSCSPNGAWVFSQDGHATFCAGGTWTTKI